MHASDFRSRSDAFTIALLVGCTAYVLALAFVPGFRRFSPLACFIKQSVGLHCPTCGLTRAMACCARLDFVGAVRFNPLVILVAPVAAFYSAGLLLRTTGRGWLLASVPRTLVVAVWVGLLAVFLLLFLVRTATWFLPEVNPDGWLIPPAKFSPAWVVATAQLRSLSRTSTP